MTTQTPATQFNTLRTQLDWLVQAWQWQPVEFQKIYEQIVQQIVAALTKPIYTFAVYLPDRVVLDPPTVTSIQRIEIRAGNVINRLRKISCRNAIVQSLEALRDYNDPAISRIAQLINYSTAQCILTGYLPNEDTLQTNYKAFEPRKMRLLTSADSAITIVEQLESFVELLRILEAICPPMIASDVYNERLGQLTTHLSAQGKALAHYYVGQMIEEIQIGWLKGTIGRGLTLHIPYFDEHTYRIAHYKVIVTPTGRIPFRPEFIVSACRMAEREVHQDTQMLQSTRWQLIAHFDRLIHAFEHKETDIGSG